MQNKHGLECPVNWDEQPSHCNWIAIDTNGDIYAYENKPKVLSDSQHWKAVDYNFWYKGETSPPADFTQCLWKRPK